MVKYVLCDDPFINYHDSFINLTIILLIRERSIATRAMINVYDLHGNSGVTRSNVGLLAVFDLSRPRRRKFLLPGWSTGCNLFR